MWLVQKLHLTLINEKKNFRSFNAQLVFTFSKSGMKTLEQAVLPQVIPVFLLLTSHKEMPPG